MDTLFVSKPILAPCRLRLADPVAALFLITTTLSIPISVDKPIVKLPRALPRGPPEVTERRLLPAIKWPIWHRRDVSPAHAVCSHAVLPVRMKAVNDARPIFAPCKLRLDDPVPALLARCTTLPRFKSTEYPLVTLPTLTPAVIANPRLPTMPCPDWQRAEVSDSHVVCSHAVLPTFTPDVNTLNPIFAPCTVILADPDAPWLM